MGLGLLIHSSWKQSLQWQHGILGGFLGPSFKPWPFFKQQRGGKGAVPGWPRMRQHG
jgi:hypothetical protein